MWRFRWDWLSFAVGFLAGALFGYLLKWLQRLGEVLRQRAATRREAQSAQAQARVLSDYRRWLLQEVQGRHLAAPLFALEEVLVPPKLLPRPPLVLEDEEALLPDDIVTLTVPHSPAWPHLATFYRAPSLTLVEALQGGAHLLLVGAPGSGKTTALLYLAWLWAARRPEAEALGERWPLYLHAATLTPAGEGAPEALWEPLAEPWREAMPGGLYRRWRNLLAEAVQQGQVLLLLDGLDELSPEAQPPLAEYLERLLSAYPGLQVVAAAAPEYYDGFTRLGLVPVPLALWTTEEAHRFLIRWGRLWREHITPGLQAAPPEVDALLLNRWLLAERSVVTPLEITLHAWAAYAGDALGPRLHHALEAYLRRMLPEEDERARAALQALAWQVFRGRGAAVSSREAGKNLEPEPTPEVLQEEPPEGAAQDLGEESPPLATASTREVRRRLPELLHQGLLIKLGPDLVGFAHPTVMAYLVGELLAQGARAGWLEGPWTALHAQVLRFAAAHGGGHEVVQHLLERDREPLRRELLAAAHALPEGPAKAPWRATVLRQLTTLLSDPLSPLGLRAEALAALVEANEPALGVLFRKFLVHRDAAVRRLAALGCGYLRDGKAVAALQDLLFDADLGVQRAAALGLVAIGTEAALQAVARLLLEGSEEQRRIAAEALANHPQEGHPTLQEGATMEEDLLVRRAVVFGLRRLGTDWARALLEKMQVEDSQWVVRTAASEAVQALQGPSPFLPRPPRPLTEEPWLVAFAASQGVGVAPGEPAYQLLERCLREGDETQRLAALERIVFEPQRDWTPFVYPLLYEEVGELREVAFATLRALAAAGAEMPHPARYGLGRGMHG